VDQAVRLCLATREPARLGGVPNARMVAAHDAPVRLPQPQACRAKNARDCASAYAGSFRQGLQAACARHAALGAATSKMRSCHRLAQDTLCWPIRAGKANPAQALKISFTWGVRISAADRVAGRRGATVTIPPEAPAARAIGSMTAPSRALHAGTTHSTGPITPPHYRHIRTVAITRPATSQALNPIRPKHHDARAPTPSLDWRETAHGTCRVLQFDDPFYALQGGRGDAHVFLAGNDLRCAVVDGFHIADALAFGTGLNFLTSAAGPFATAHPRVCRSPSLRGLSLTLQPCRRALGLCSQHFACTGVEPGRDSPAGFRSARGDWRCDHKTLPRLVPR